MRRGVLNRRAWVAYLKHANPDHHSTNDLIARLQTER
jgi:hypothetical protein